MSGLGLFMANIQNTRICRKNIMMVLRLSFICIVVGQGNSTRGPEEFVRNEALSNF